MKNQFGFPSHTHRYSYHEHQGGGKRDEVGDAHVERGSMVRCDFGAIGVVERMLNSEEDVDVKGMK